MKELSLFEIRDMALESGRAVFSMQQLSNLIGKPKAVCTVYAARLVKKGLAVRVLKGKISFERDEFIIATQLVEPSYISLGSGLLFLGLTKQVQKNIECVTTKNSLKFKGLGIVYHKIPVSLFFGFKKMAKGKSYVMVAEPEKAVLDALYLNIFLEKNLQDFSRQVSLQKMRTHLKKFRGRGRKKLERMLEND